MYSNSSITTTISEKYFCTASYTSNLAHFLREYKKLFPNQPFIELADRRAFLVRNDYKDQLGITNPNEVYEQEGWFFNLPPVEGAIETFNWLNEREDVEVVICSSPCTNYKVNCLPRAPKLDHFFT